MKKRPVTKLVLNPQTIRTLGNDELTRVIGGAQDCPNLNCPDRTQKASGCTMDPADLINQSLDAKKA